MLALVHLFDFLPKYQNGGEWNFICRLQSIEKCHKTIATCLSWNSVPVAVDNPQTLNVCIRVAVLSSEKFIIIFSGGMSSHVNQVYLLKHRTWVYKFEVRLALYLSISILCNFILLFTFIRTSVSYFLLHCICLKCPLLHGLRTFPHFLLT